MIIITPLKQYDVIAWTISSQFANSTIVTKIKINVINIGTIFR